MDDRGGAVLPITEEEPEYEEAPSSTTPPAPQYDPTQLAAIEVSDVSIKSWKREIERRPRAMIDTDAVSNAQALGTPWHISSPQQLQIYVEQSADEVFNMLQQLRYQRDFGHANALAQEKRAKRAQERLRHMQFESPSHSPIRSITPSSKSRVKHPDPPCFEGDRKKWEAWKFQIKMKLEAEEDRWEGEADKVRYVTNRLGGDAINLIQDEYNASGTNFRTVQELLQYLDDHYEDPNKVINARNDYAKCRMNYHDSFADFFAEFIKLARRMGYSGGKEHGLLIRHDLLDRLPRRFREPYFANGMSHDNIYEMKAYFLRLESSFKAMELSYPSDRSVRKESSAGKINKSKTAGGGSSEKIVSAGAGPRSTPAPNKEVGTCWACGSTDHRRGDPSCPKHEEVRRTREPSARVHEIGDNSERDSSSDNDSAGYSSENSKNE